MSINRTLIDRADVSGVTLTVESVPGSGLFVFRDGVPVGEEGLGFTSIADEQRRFPTLVRGWLSARPLAERYARCGITVPAWMREATR